MASSRVHFTSEPPWPGTAGSSLLLPLLRPRRPQPEAPAGTVTVLPASGPRHWQFELNC